MCIVAEELVLASSAQELLLDPSPTPRIIPYRGLLHGSSLDCYVCTSCWSTSGGWWKGLWQLYIPACVSHLHNGTISSAGFLSEKAIYLLSL